MSHTSLTYHLIFGTKDRFPAIDVAHERELYKFIYDLSKNHGAFIWRIGGMPDHIHILCDIPAKYSVSEFVKYLKSESSKFMKVNRNFSNWRGWAEGYGAFTIDASLRKKRIEYIINQKTHHIKKNFTEEYRELLLDAGYKFEQ